MLTFLRITARTLELATGPLSTTMLQTAVGGYFAIPWVYPGHEDGGIFLVTAAKPGVSPPTVFIPELLHVVAGPVLLVGCRASGDWRSLDLAEQRAFTLEAVASTRVPRLGYRRPR